MGVDGTKPVRNTVVQSTGQQQPVEAPRPDEKQSVIQQGVGSALTAGRDEGSKEHVIDKSLSLGDFRFGPYVKEAIAFPGTKTFDKLVAPNDARKTLSDQGYLWMMLEGGFKVGGGYTIPLAGYGTFSIAANRERSVMSVMPHKLPQQSKEQLKNFRQNALAAGEGLISQLKDTVKSIPANAEAFRQLNMEPGSVIVVKSKSQLDAGVSFGKKILDQIPFVNANASVGVSGTAAKKKVKVVERIATDNPDRHVYKISIVEEKDLIGRSFVGVNAGLDRAKADAKIQAAIDVLAGHLGVPGSVIEKADGPLSGALLGPMKNRQFAFYRTGEMGMVTTSDTEALVEITKRPNEAAKPERDDLWNALWLGDEDDVENVIKTIKVPSVAVDTKEEYTREGWLLSGAFLGTFFQNTEEKVTEKSDVVIRIPGVKEPIKKTVETARRSSTRGGWGLEFFGISSRQLTQRYTSVSGADGSTDSDTPFGLAMTIPTFSQQDLDSTVAFAKAFGQNFNPPRIQERIEQETGLRKGYVNVGVVIDHQEREKLLKASNATYWVEAGKAFRQMQGINAENSTKNLAPWALSEEAAQEFEKAWADPNKTYAPKDDRSSSLGNEETIKTYKQRAYEKLYPGRNVEDDVAVFRAVKMLVEVIDNARNGQDMKEALAAFGLLKSLKPEMLGAVMITLRRVAGVKLSGMSVKTEYPVDQKHPSFDFVGSPETAVPPDHDQQVNALKQEMVTRANIK